MLGWVSFFVSKNYSKLKKNFNPWIFLLLDYLFFEIDKIVQNVFLAKKYWVYMNCATEEVDTGFCDNELVPLEPPSDLLNCSTMYLEGG